MAEGRSVQLYVYDLTQGMARSLSPMLLGKQVGAVRTCQARDSMLPIVEHVESAFWSDKRLSHDPARGYQLRRPAYDAGAK